MPKKDPALKAVLWATLWGIKQNMTVFEYGNDMVLVDAGLMFPDDACIDLVSLKPDYNLCT